MSAENIKSKSTQHCLHADETPCSHIISNHSAFETCLAVDFFGLRDRGEFVKQLNKLLENQGCQGYSRAGIECLVDNCTKEVDACGLSVDEITNIVEFWSERLGNKSTQWIP